MTGAAVGAEAPWWNEAVDVRGLLQEQIDYYRSRAPEYDVTSALPGDPLAAYGAGLETALDRFRPRGRVLELASGTGSWTRQLLRHASAVTALDSSPEMHELSRQKLGNDPRVRSVEADVFSWTPSECYDVVFFANWLSHVPPPKLEPFWALVRRALAPEGRVFLVDEAADAEERGAAKGRARARTGNSNSPKSPV